MLEAVSMSSQIGTAGQHSLETTYKYPCDGKDDNNNDEEYRPSVFRIISEPHIANLCRLSIRNGRWGSEIVSKYPTLMKQECS